MKESFVDVRFDTLSARVLGEILNVLFVSACKSLLPCMGLMRITFPQSVFLPLFFCSSITETQAISLLVFHRVVVAFISPLMQ